MSPTSSTMSPSQKLETIIRMIPTITRMPPSPMPPFMYDLPTRSTDTSVVVPRRGGLESARAAPPLVVEAQDQRGRGDPVVVAGRDDGRAHRGQAAPAVRSAASAARG